MVYAQPVIQESLSPAVNADYYPLQALCLNTHPYVNGSGQGVPLGSKWEGRLAQSHLELFLT